MPTGKKKIINNKYFVSFFFLCCIIIQERTYDRIHVGACCPTARKDTLLNLLAPGGILVTPMEGICQLQFQVFLYFFFFSFSFLFFF